MSFYCVMVEGSGLTLETPEPVSGVGFVKNEYVFASGSEVARKIAVERVSAKLERKKVNPKCAARITAGEVHVSTRYWKTLLDDGFIFFHEDGDGSG